MGNICLLKYDMTDRSGGERVTSLLSQALSRQFCVHVVSITGRGEPTYFPLDPQVHYAAFLPGHSPIRSTTVAGSRQLRAYLKQNQIDVCLSIGGNVNLFLYLATRGTKIRTVFCEHMNLVTANRMDRANRLLRWLASRFADRIITLTQQDREAYLNTYHLPPERVDYIYNWVDDRLLSSSGSCDLDAHRMITVGRFDYLKGMDYLVEAAKIVLERHPDWQWDVYGDGPDLEAVRQQVQEAGLEDRLHLMGARSDIYERYGRYSLYVMTSRSEGLPMVLLEAKSQGLPVVSFDCRTGPREILSDGVDGFLVPPYDTGLLAEKICLLMEDDALRRAFSSHARDCLPRFEKEKIVRKWCALLEELSGMEGKGEGS